MKMHLKDHELSFEVWGEGFHFSGGFGMFRFWRKAEVEMESTLEEMRERGGLYADAARILAPEKFSEPGFYWWDGEQWKWQRGPAAKLTVGERYTGVVGEIGPKTILVPVAVDGGGSLDIHVSQIRKAGANPGDQIGFRVQGYGRKFDSYRGGHVVCQ